MKKRYYLIALAVVVLIMITGFCIPAAAQPPYDSVELYVKVNGTEGRINFRSGPGTAYPVMSELPNGQILPITEQVYNAEDGFYFGQTVINGVTGYVSLRQTITVYKTGYSEPATQSPEPVTQYPEQELEYPEPETQNWFEEMSNAFLTQLRSDEYHIRMCEDWYGGGNILLYNIVGIEAPELFYVTTTADSPERGGGYGSFIKIYLDDHGSVLDITPPIIYPTADGYERTYQDLIYQCGAAGSLCVRLFTANQNGHLYAAYSAGDLWSRDVYMEYYYEDWTLHILNFFYRYVEENGTVHCMHNDGMISEEEFLLLESDLLNNMDVFLMGAMPYPGPQAATMTFDEAVQVLQQSANTEPFSEIPQGGRFVPISEMRAEDETALVTFLEKYTWLAKDYDYTDVFGGDHWRNLLEGILCHPSCIDETIYPGVTAFENWNGADPQGRWTSYRSFNEEKADWILRNIFNCTDETIRLLKEQTLLNQNIYLQDGTYYSFLGGVGDGYMVNSYEIQYNGTEYIVNYSITDYYPNIVYLSAVLQLKEIDGNRYWSLYFMR